MKKILLNVLKKLAPISLVGGLEISDFVIRFVRIEKGKLTTASLRLPKDIVSQGEIKNSEHFKEALKDLHFQLVGQSKKEIEVVITLPGQATYSYYFTLPAIDEKEIDEAARLNLQMNSPLNFEEVYADWQIIESDKNQFGIIGAYVKKSLVEEIDSSLRKTGFLPIAFEFPGLSLSRLIKDLNPGFDLENKIFLVLNISREGLNLSILKRGFPFFDRFLSWKVLYKDKKIELKILREILKQEIQKVINFCSIELRAVPEALINIGTDFKKEVEELKEELKIEVIFFQPKTYSLPSFWFTALGSALRAFSLRTEDVFLSLSSLRVVQRFNQRKILSFIDLWRNIFVAVLLFLLLVFGSSWFFLYQKELGLKDQLSLFVRHPQIEQVGQLQKRAEKFNRLVNLIRETKKISLAWHPFFKTLADLSEPEIILDHVVFAPNDLTVRIQARAVNEEKIIAFKNNLQAQAKIEQIDLPLASITPTMERWVRFDIFFNIKP